MEISRPEASANSPSADWQTDVFWFAGLGIHMAGHSATLALTLTLTRPCYPHGRPLRNLRIVVVVVVVVVINFIPDEQVGK